MKTLILCLAAGMFMAAPELMSMGLLLAAGFVLIKSGLVILLA